MDPQELVKNFGILPAGQPIPTGIVRGSMRTSTIVGQYVFSILFLGFFALAGFVLLGVAFLASLTMETRLMLGALGVFFLCATAFIYALGPANDYQWVEIDGDTLRAKHLYTQKVTHRRIADINDILSEVLMIKTVAAQHRREAPGRIRAFAFRFHDLPKGIKIFRPEMDNVAELVSAVIGKMSEYGQVQPEIINMEGSPMVRRVFWAKPPESPKAHD